MKALAALLLLLASTPALAADPCARYEDADAYNNCLARLGPTAGRHALRAPAPKDFASPRAGHRAERRRAARRLPTGFVQKPAPHGRVRVEFRLR